MEDLVSAIRLHNQDWSIQPIQKSPAGARRSAAGGGLTFPTEFLAADASVVEEFVAQPAPAVRRAGVAAAPLDFSYDHKEGEAVILAIRHPSGALTFHRPVEAVRRGVQGQRRARFIVAPRSVDMTTGKRGIVSQAVRAVIIKVAKAALDKIAGVLLPK